MPLSRPNAQPPLSPMASTLMDGFGDLRDLLALSCDIVWETAFDGTLAKISGMRPDQPEPRLTNLIGQPFLSSESPQPILNSVAKRVAFRDVPVDFEFAGEIITLRLSGFPIGPRSGSAYRGIGRDVSEYARQERAFWELGEQNRSLLSAIEASPICITIADARQPDLPLIYVNPAFTRLTGYRLADVYGRNCRFLQGADTEADAVQAIRLAIQERAAVEVELTNYRKDGTAFVNRISLAPVFGSDGTLNAYIGHQRDRSAELAREAMERVQSRLASIGELASGVAHEINNLLQPAMMGPDILARRIPAEDERSHHTLQRIKASAMRARDVLRTILTFARMDEPNLDLLEIRNTFLEAIDFLREILPPGIALHLIGFDSEVGTAMLNKTQAVQVMANLVTNAAHAMNQKGRLTVMLDTVVVQKRAAQILDLPSKTYARISVTDDGPGIDPKIQASIFDPLFTTKPIGIGTGLGLSIVYGIVQNWGGAIKVESVLGEGATFMIYLPIVE